MKVLQVYLHLYAECVAQSLKAIQQNAWTLLLPTAIAIAFALAIAPASQLGIIGGFLLYFGMAAASSSYLYFLGELVGRSSVSLKELKTSFGRYFWSLINLGFVLWVADFVLINVLRSPFSFRPFFLIILMASAAPEVIYQRGTYGGLATIQESFAFIQDNWVEWLIPNIPFFLILYLIPSFASSIWMLAVLGALIHVGMVFRGFLFEQLVGTSHRQRMFKHTQGGLRG